MTERAETGPVRFGDDWPGVFFRGDDAYGYAVAIEQIGDWLDADARPAGDILLARQRLEALELLLLSSNHKTSLGLTQLRPWAACTEGGRAADAEPPRDRAALAAAVRAAASRTGTNRSTERPFWCVRCGGIGPPCFLPVSP